MKLSKTTNYAIQAVTALAQSDFNETIPCSELAKCGKLPERFLLQILRALVSKSILQSARGVDGGYKLTRHPGQISLLDVVEVFEASLRTDPPHIDGLGPLVQMRVATALERSLAAARNELERVTIADLLQ